MQKHYIQAVLEMIHAGKSPDEVLRGLDRVLVAKGHQSLKPAVLSGVVRILEAESDRTTTTVTVARASDTEKYATAIASALVEMKADTKYIVKEDDTLIGGFIAEIKNTVHDASYKTALVKLYRTLAK